VKHLGGFRLLRELGKGGMGVVYLAHDSQLDREVALKVLPVDRSSAVDRQRFLREGQAAATVRHLNVLRIHDIGEEEGYAYLAMEVAREGSLRDRLNEVGLLDPAEAGELFAQLAEGVGALHAAGILHRDIKPANVLFDDGRPLVADLGLAQIVDRETRLTETGVTMGTPAYMAPEQVFGQRELFSPRMDVYALGVVLYESLSGELPVQGDTYLQLMDAITRTRPRPLRDLRPEIPAGLERVCLRCLAKDPAERYADGATLASALRQAASGANPRHASWMPLALAVACLSALAAFGAAGFSAFSQTSSPPASPPSTPAPSARASSQSGGPALASKTNPKRGPGTSSREPVLSWVGVKGQLYLWRDRSIDLRVEAEGSVDVIFGGIVPSKPALFECEELTTREGSPLYLVPVWRGKVDPARPQAVPLSASHLQAQPFDRRVAVVVDSHGRVRGEPLLLNMKLAPPWLIDLPKHLRPSALPEGLRARSTQGEYENERDRSTLVWIPPGPTTLFDSEGRSHSRRLEAGVFMGKHEVTWGQVKAYYRGTGRELSQRVVGDTLPASPGWFLAAAYARWAGARLPSEVEWSRAAWAGESSWIRATKEHSIRPHPRPADVGPDSPFGCKNMLGNLREHVADPAHAFDSPVPARVVSPMNDAGQTIVLGGSWKHRPARATSPPDRGQSDVGFRLCVDPHGRTRAVSDLSWEVRVGKFSPKPPSDSQAPWPAPLRRSLASWGDHRWRVRELMGLQIYRAQWKQMGGAASMRGLHLEARATQKLPAGSYAFTVLSDDGVRVHVGRSEGEETIIDRWNHHAPTFDRARFRLDVAGEVSLRLEYCNIVGGSELKVSLFPE
jgi:serine/threonine protein kinase